MYDPVTSKHDNLLIQASVDLLITLRNLSFNPISCYRFYSNYSCNNIHPTDFGAPEIMTKLLITMPHLLDNLCCWFISLQFCQLPLTLLRCILCISSSVLTLLMFLFCYNCSTSKPEQNFAPSNALKYAM